MPNSKIIILLRDPRDIIDSKIDEVSSGGWELDLKKGVRDELPKKNRLNHIKRTSTYWVSLIEILMRTYENHHKDFRYKLRYEDLLKNTLTELQKIYKFLEIDVDDDKLRNIIKKYSFEKIPDNKKGKGKFRRSASPGSWIENFNDEEKKIMNDILKDKLHELGY